MALDRANRLKPTLSRISLGAYGTGGALQTHLHIAVGNEREFHDENFGIMTVAASCSDRRSAAQSFDLRAPPACSDRRPRAEDSSPLFAKMIMPSSTDVGAEEVPATTRGAALPLLYACLVGSGLRRLSTSRGLQKGAVESKREWVAREAPSRSGAQSRHRLRVNLHRRAVLEAASPRRRDRDDVASNAMMVASRRTTPRSCGN